MCLHYMAQDICFMILSYHLDIFVKYAMWVSEKSTVAT